MNSSPATFKKCFLFSVWNNILKIILKIYNLPVKSPAITVPTNGVWYFSWTLPINLNRRPSDAIAYIIRGRGNTAPKRMVKNKLMDKSLENRLTFYSFTTLDRGNLYNLCRQPFSRNLENGVIYHYCRYNQQIRYRIQLL